MIGNKYKIQLTIFPSLHGAVIKVAAQFYNSLCNDEGVDGALVLEWDGLLVLYRQFKERV